MTDRTIRNPPPAASPAPTQALLAWYADHRRALPWRGTRDPYRVWLSEIMAQQTRVGVVTKYYERFLAVFPTVAALAAADLDDVLALWAGLGYYARARNLHRAAGVIVRERGGRFPRAAAEWQELPGVGPYTARMIASIVADEPLAAVDGNIRRVMARFHALRQPVNVTAGVRQVQAAAQQLLAPHAPGDFNQALMDLGSSLCTPRAPRCAECPLRPACRAAASADPAVFPVRRAKRPLRQVRAVALSMERGDGRRWLVRRAAGGLLGRLWTLPGRELATGESPRLAAERLLRELLGEAGAGLAAAGRVHHTFTHQRRAVYVFSAPVARRTPSAGGRWFSPPEMLRAIVSTLDRKLCAAAGVELREAREPRAAAPPKPAPRSRPRSA